MTSKNLSAWTREDVGYCVYCIHEVQPGGLVKIGVSSNPEQRLKSLQAANPRKLVLHAFDDDYETRGDAVSWERQIHEHLTERGWYLRGEWFTEEALRWFETHIATRRIENEQRS